MKFREFLLNEEIGLGDLGLRLSNIMQDSNFDNRIGAWMTSDWTGSDQSRTLGYTGHALDLPGYDLQIPQVERTGRITMLQKHTNPIYVRLTDGTEAFFTWDEYKKIEGEPQIGKVMTLIFQRNPVDRSENRAKIDKAIVRG